MRCSPWPREVYAMVEVANDIAEIIEQKRKKDTIIGKRYPKLDAPVKVKGLV